MVSLSLMIRGIAFIDDPTGMSYYFDVQFKKYRLEKHTERDDAWTRELISKVHCKSHPSCDFDD